MVYLNLLTVALFLQTYPSFFTDGAAFNNKPLSGIFASQTIKMRQNFLIPHLIHWWWACAILLIRYICIGLWSKVESARYFILFYFLKKKYTASYCHPSYVYNKYPPMAFIACQGPRHPGHCKGAIGKWENQKVGSFLKVRKLFSTPRRHPHGRPRRPQTCRSVCSAQSVDLSYTVYQTVEMLSVYLSHLLIFTFVVCSHLLRISSVRIDWRNSCKETIHILPKLTVTVRMNLKSGSICLFQQLSPRGRIFLLTTPLFDPSVVTHAKDFSWWVGQGSHREAP